MNHFYVYIPYNKDTIVVMKCEVKAKCNQYKLRIYEFLTCVQYADVVPKCLMW